MTGGQTKGAIGLRINEELCISCGQCIPYCPVSAIKEEDGVIRIDDDQCVECGVCRRSGVCPTDAHYQPERKWPRILRSLFSDPITVHPSTGVAGRGTDELKTNDVTNRFVVGELGFGIELGRPNTGTTFRDLEKVSKRLAMLGARFEPKNPVTTLMKDQRTGEIRDDVLDERVLTAIIEFTVPDSAGLRVLETLEEAAKEIDTVFSLDLIYRVAGSDEPPVIKAFREKGYFLSDNGKVCVGLGRRSNPTN